MQRQFFEVPEYFELRKVSVDLIDVDDSQEKKSYSHLLHTIQQVGVLSTVVLMERGDRFKVIAGKRRVLAAREAGLESIPAKVFTEDVSAEQIAYLTIAENMNRKPNPAAEAEALYRIQKSYAWDIETMSQKLGLPVRHIRARLKLLNLHPEFFERLRNGSLTVSTAQKLARLPKVRQKELLSEEKLTIVKVAEKIKNETVSELLSIDELFAVPETNPLERIIKDIKNLIEHTRNGNKPKLEKALRLLEEVK